MDWARVLLERFFGFIAALIPGSFVLLVLILHRPDLWERFWGLNYLGYETKMVALLLAAFFAGITISGFTGAVVGGIIGGVSQRNAQKKATHAATSAQNPQQQSQPQPTQPNAEEQVAGYWRNENWRRLLTAYLGTAAPDNLPPIQDQNEYQQLVRYAQSLPDAQQQQQAFAQINARVANDSLWADWWNRLHLLTLPKNDPRMAIALTLESNFGGACLVILISAPWTPLLRQWWIVLPSLFWVLITLLQTYQQYAAALNPMQSYLKQMEYLQTRVGKGEQSDSDKP